MVDYVINPVIDKFIKNCHLYVDPRDEEIRAKYDYYECDDE